MIPLYENILKADERIIINPIYFFGRLKEQGYTTTEINGLIEVMNESEITNGNEYLLCSKSKYLQAIKKEA